MIYKRCWYHESITQERSTRKMTEPPKYFEFLNMVMTLSKQWTALCRMQLPFPTLHRGIGRGKKLQLCESFCKPRILTLNAKPHSDCRISCLLIYVLPWWCLTRLSTSRRNTSEVCPSCITSPYSISLSLSYLSRTAKKKTYVRHYKPSFLLAANSRPRIYDSERWPFM